MAKSVKVRLYSHVVGASCCHGVSLASAVRPTGKPGASDKPAEKAIRAWATWSVGGGVGWIGGKGNEGKGEGGGGLGDVGGGKGGGGEGE